MASDVSIVNGALIKLGAKTITAPDFDEPSVEAKLARSTYTEIRDAVFREHPWNCLIARASLPKLVDPPAFGFDCQFQLPADCLRVLTLNDEGDLTVINGLVVVTDNTAKFKIEGRLLLTDESEAKIIYIAAKLDPNEYDSMLRELLSSRLAAEWAYPLTKNARLVGSMWELYKSKLPITRTIDGMEGTPDSFQSDEIGGVRR